MPPNHFKTSGHLLVCQGQSCQARGSGLLYRALRNHLERAGLAYYRAGGSLRLTESGCLGACSHGPTLCVYREWEGRLEEGWYAAADLPLASAVAQAAHGGTELPEDRKYGP